MIAGPGRVDGAGSDTGAGRDIRPDIQALRGIAVTLVVLEHFAIGPFRQGFLGVDIFFVISGFLMTGIIARDLEAGSFSFAGFYARRARRILPAAYVTILLTSLGAIWFLDSIEMAALTSQVWGALTYTINIVLWQQVGYFDVGAGYKPLLHMWSLAIEEQFYILFPALLALTPRRWWLHATGLIGVASLLACIFVASSSLTSAFYLLPTRAWELMIGAVGALLWRRGYRISHAPWLLWPALLAIAGLSVQGAGLPHPGVDAAIVCVATLVVILCDNQRVARSVPGAILALVGAISYSLYLVHWPLVVFLNNAADGAPSLTARCGALALAFAIASLLYLAVEQPFRRMRLRAWTTAGAALIAGAALAAAQLGAQAFASNGYDFADLRRPNYGLDRLCDNYIFENRAECRTSDKPATLVWGDSYAMFTASGARHHLKEGMAQATYSACPPFAGYAPYNPAVDAADAISKYCIAFNDGVLKFLSGASGIHTVVIAASFWQYTVPGYQMMRRTASGDIVIEPSSLDTASQNIADTVRRLISSGMTVIIVAPPPGAGDGDLACAERLLTGKFHFGPASDCTTPADQMRANTATIDALILAAERAGAQVIRLSDAVCDQQVCRTVIDKVLLYRDSGHLSYDGARTVFDILSRQHRLPAPLT